MSIRRQASQQLISAFLALTALSLAAIPRAPLGLPSLVSEARAQDDFFDDEDFEDFEDFEEPIPHYTVPPLPDAGSYDSSSSAPAQGGAPRQAEAPVQTRQAAPSPEYRSTPQLSSPVTGIDVGNDEPKPAPVKAKPHKEVSLTDRAGVSVSGGDGEALSLIRWKSSALAEKAARELLSRQGISMEITPSGNLTFARAGDKGAKPAPAAAKGTKPAPASSAPKGVAPNLYLRFAGNVYPGLKLGDGEALLFSSAEGKRAKVRFYRLQLETTPLATLASQDSKAFKASIDALAAALRKENQQRLGWSPELVGVHHWLAQQSADIVARKDYLKLRVAGVSTQLDGSPRVADLISHLRDADARFKQPSAPHATRDATRKLVERLAQVDRTITPEYLQSFDAVFDRHYQGTIRALQAMDHHSLRFEILRGAGEAKVRAARLAAAGFTRAEAAMTVDYASFVWMAPDSGLIDAFEINLLRTLARQATATFERAAGESFRKLKPHQASVNRLGGTEALRSILQDATGFVFDKKIDVQRSRSSAAVRMDFDAYQVRGKIEQLIRSRAADKSLVLEWDAIDAMAKELLSALART